MLPGRHRRTAAALALAVVGAIWASCAPPDTGGPCTGSACILPTVSCPADMTVTGAPATGASVVYTVSEIGGTPPVSTTCSPASGVTFPVGTTTVNCTARDAIDRSGVCSFRVTLSASHLSAMHFMAFGDSTTAGENGNEPFPPGNDNPVTCTPQTSVAMAHVQSARPSFIDVPDAYPTQLLSKLQAQFPGEAFTMDNEGLRGETAADGVSRLAAPDCLPTLRPHVLLLFEGINDIAAQGYAPSGQQEQTIVGNLRRDVSSAFSAGVQFVFVSTILPVHACPATSTNCRVTDNGDPSGYVQFAAAANIAIDQTNALIRSNVPGAVIVDGNAAMKAADPTLNSFFDGDGLHPNPAGYAVVAQAFMDAIASRIPITSMRRRR